MTRTILLSESSFLRLKHHKIWLNVSKQYTYTKCNGLVVLHISFFNSSLDKLLTKFSLL